MSIHNLKNKHLSIDISSLGAELRSIVNQSSNFQYLWQADKKIWGRTAPILFPIIGKEDGDGIIIDNIKYSIPQHGFARDFEFDVIYNSEDEIIFELNDTKIPGNIYPYKFRLIVEYTLVENTVKQKYTVMNEAETNLFYSIGSHPGFALSTKKLNDYQIEFVDYKELVNKETQNNLLTGNVNLMSKTNIIDLNQNIFKNGVLIIPVNQKSSINLKSKNNNQVISLKIENFNHVGIWSPIGVEDFVCIEPWKGITGTENKYKQLIDKEEIQCLSSGQKHEYKFEINLK